MKNLRALIIVVAALLVGIYIAGYYVTYLHRESLRDWRVVRVSFKEVGGLKAKRGVTLNGHAVGRVKEVRMWKDRQMAVLELEPGLKIYEHDVFEIVPTSALGSVGIEISRAEDEVARGRLLPLDYEEVIEGKLREALGGGTPTPGRRKELKRLLDEMADVTEDLTRPEGGIVGRMTADPDGIEELRAALKVFEKSSVDLNEGLARIEQRNSRLSSEDYLLSVRETTLAMSQTFQSMRDALRETVRGEGGFSQMVTDPAYAESFRAAIVQQARFFEAAERGDLEGVAGALLDPNGEAYEGLREAAEVWNRETGAGVRGEGNFALLSSKDVGDEVRKILRDLPDALLNLKKSPLVENPQAKQDVEDLFGNADDLLIQMRRGVRGLRRGLGDKTFQGAVFSVF